MAKEKFDWNELGANKPVSMMRAQVLSTEVIATLAFFMIIISFFSLVWLSMHYSYMEEREDRIMQASLDGVADMLILSPGEPSNWEETQLQGASAIGLAFRPKVLSARKLEVFQSLNGSNYITMKEAMGAGSYEIHVLVRNSTASLFEFGKRPDFESPSYSMAQMYGTERVALLNGSTVSVKVEMWRMKRKFI